MRRRVRNISTVCGFHFVLEHTPHQISIFGDPLRVPLPQFADGQASWLTTGESGWLGERARIGREYELPYAGTGFNRVAEADRYGGFCNGCMLYVDLRVRD